MFTRRYGPYAFVAGASEGLGECFAHGVAARGLNVLVAARRQAELERVAADIRARHGVQAVAVPLDLATSDLEERARDLARRYEVGLLIHNAAYAPRGDLLDRPLDEQLRALDVNARSLLILTHVFGGPMATRGRGGLVVMSSMAGFQGTALLATYAATKAFGRVLAEGLWEELRDRGVDVLACCAGATRTPGWERSAPNEAGTHVMTPDEVVEETLAALGRGPVLVPGLANKLAGAILGRLPRRVAVRVISRATRKLYE